jgi:hypothetical protein
VAVATALRTAFNVVRKHFGVKSRRFVFRNLVICVIFHEYLMQQMIIRTEAAPVAKAKPHRVLKALRLCSFFSKFYLLGSSKTQANIYSQNLCVMPRDKCYGEYNPKTMREAWYW